MASLVGSVANGLDFSAVTFSGNAIAMPGWKVLGTGEEQIASTFDSTHGNLLIQSNNSDSSVLGLWDSSTSPSTGARNFSLASNSLAMGELDFLGSTNNVGVPGTKVFSITSAGAIQIPAIHSTTGTRTLCVDSSGNVTASASGCSGT
jgi:hypothetical protein